MEIMRVTLLRHIDTGLFLSTDPNSMPHTKNIRKARRFYFQEEIGIFLTQSAYRPDNPENYELVTLKISYELEEIENVRVSQSPTEAFCSGGY